MVCVVLGMSKSGTTLVSKTLHESGINMNPGVTGNYAKSKYEDPEMIKILLTMYQSNRLRSLYYPQTFLWDKKVENMIHKFLKRQENKKDWGVKQPWLTLVWDVFRIYFPENTIVIGVKRSFSGLISHWTKRGKNIDRYKVQRVQNHYNKIIDKHKIPVVSFEKFLQEGPKQLEKIVGRKLKDVRVK